MGAFTSRLRPAPPPPKRCRRAASAPAVLDIEELLPHDMIGKVVMGGCLKPSDYGPLTICNKSFKEYMYSPPMIVRRGGMALIGQDCDQSVAMAERFYRIGADRGGVEELIFLAQIEEKGSTNVAAAVDLLRRALAEKDTPQDDLNFVLLHSPANAFDTARAALAKLLGASADPDLVAEALALFQEVVAIGPREDAIGGGTCFRDAACGLAGMMIDGVQGAGGGADEALELLARVDEPNGECHCLTGEAHYALAAYAEAFQAFQRGVSDTHPKAMFLIARCHERGHGTSVNLPLAYQCYFTGAQGGRDARALGKVNELMQFAVQNPNHENTQHIMRAYLAFRAMSELAGRVGRGELTMDGALGVING